MTAQPSIRSESEASETPMPFFPGPEIRLSPISLERPNIQNNATRANETESGVQRRPKLRLNPPRKRKYLTLNPPAWPPVRNVGWEGPIPQQPGLRDAPINGIIEGTDFAPWMKPKTGGGMAYSSREEEIRQNYRQYMFFVENFGVEYANAQIY